MVNLNQLTIQEAQRGLREKKFSSVELVTSCLERIKKLNFQINALITVCEKEALREAAKADDKIANSKFEIRDFPLLGIPIAAKDNFLTCGIRTTAASKVLGEWIPPYDATAVARLKAAGAIIIGKANMDAWGHGSSGENSDFGLTKNPWNSEYVPGGSSSGSAAAVASEMVFAATGTDTGGSVRLPSSFCNLVGLKPTYGRVSRYGVVAMASSLDSIGHLTKTIEEAALILQITSGFDSKDATCSAVEVPDYTQNLTKGVKGLKIGVPKEYFTEGIASEVEDKIKEAIKKLEELGLEVTEVSLPHTKYAIAAYYIIQGSEVSSNLARYDGIRYGFPRENFGDEAKRRIMLGTYALSSGYYDQYYLKAQKVRTLIKQDFEKAFQECDCLITPVSPTLPWKLGEKVDDPLAMYLSDIFTVTASLAGIPALSVPAGFVQSSQIELPVGIPFLGPQFSEAKLCQVGYAYQEATEYYKQKPKI